MTPAAPGAAAALAFDVGIEAPNMCHSSYNDSTCFSSNILTLPQISSVEFRGISVNKRREPPILYALPALQLRKKKPFYSISSSECFILGSKLLLLCVGEEEQRGACGTAERIMIRKRLRPFVVWLRSKSSSNGSPMSGFSSHDLGNVSSIIAHHSAVAVVWSSNTTPSCGLPKSSSAKLSTLAPPSLSADGPADDVTLWLSHAILQSKALFSIVEPGSCLSNRERLLSRHSQWIRLPRPMSSPAAIKEVLETAADAIGEIVWPGGSRDRVLTPKCQLRLKKVYELSVNADVSVRAGSTISSNITKTLICMIVPTLSPHGVTEVSQLPLLEVFLSSFARSIGCGGRTEGESAYEFGVYVAYDQVHTLELLLFKSIPSTASFSTLY